MVRKKFAVLLSALFVLNAASLADLKSEQKRYPRVRTAYKEKEEEIKKWLDERDIKPASMDIFIRVFKKEGMLEVWVKKRDSMTYTHLLGYKICAPSGTLGPKRKDGDLQVPEDFYHIEIFNPASNFYLSLGINYPNKSDRILGVRDNLGIDIYIHGSCVTIGCIPINDDKIKELYVLALEAKNSGQEKIPVLIFPTRMDDTNFNAIKEEFSEETEILRFWENLKLSYDFFETHKYLPQISVNSRGSYLITNE